MTGFPFHCLKVDTFWCVRGKTHSFQNVTFSVQMDGSILSQDTQSSAVSPLAWKTKRVISLCGMSGLFPFQDVSIVTPCITDLNGTRGRRIHDRSDKPVKMSTRMTADAISNCQYSKIIVNRYQYQRCFVFVTVSSV